MKKKPTLFKSTLTLFFALVCQILIAQDAQGNAKALALIKKNAAAIGLSDENITNARISGAYDDAASGTTLVYLQQTYLGIDVDKTIQVLAFKNGTLVSAAGSRIDVDRSVTPTSPGLQKKLAAPGVTAIAAIQAAAQHLRLPSPSSIRFAAGQDLSKSIDVGDLGIAKENVTVRLVWMPQRTFERIKLAWEVNLSPKKTPDSWRVLVDAKAGNVIKKENYTVYDNWYKPNNGGNQFRTESKTGNNAGVTNSNTSRNPFVKDINSVSYRVIPFPAEAPDFPNGADSLVTDPWKLSPPNSGATPFNWNSDGVLQYRLSRGNNVLAQEDLVGDNGHGRKAKGTVQNDHLYFNFKPDYNKAPTDSINQSFAITNLFYWNNIMHDLSYQYGFDERAGNFQQNNLGRGGRGLDLVFADAQDGSGRFNANFSTPPDGYHPRMQMFLFGANPAKLMKINAPDTIAGDVLAVESAVSPKNTLAQVGTTTGDVVLYDEVDTLNDACSPTGNSNALKGKIALIDRGGCNFTVKILNAQNAGAIAVIVADNVPGEPPFIMGGTDTSIVIPAVMIGYEDATRIKLVLSTGNPVNVTLNADVPLLDGDLDNGVICHEYTHGISNRLTGGPFNTSCLQNVEQMGEGWSDYISLMTITDWRTATLTDGLKPRGIGTYVSGQPTEGLGIRQYPYTVDMSINPHTYADLTNGFLESHDIGEIWATVLWDMTWFIIAQDGINKDIFNAQGEGGNSVAYKLVMTGMKLQPCSPGFIDARNAILKADTLLYNGRHSCAIWRAFARRGMGVGASQGSSDAAGDEIVDFTEGAVLVTKRVDKPVAAPGADLTYTINLEAKGICGREVKQQYSAVTDSLPGNVTYVSSDGTYNPANRTVTFNNIDINSGDNLTYTIKVKVNDNTVFPDSVYLNDDANTPAISGQWTARNGNNLAWSKLFVVDPHRTYTYTYYSSDTSGKDDSKLVTTQQYFIPGNTTTLSFFHWIISEDFMNGGVVEITADKGKSWQDLGPYMSGFTYTETIMGNSVLKGRRAFAGFNYNGYYGTTTVDLSAYAGKEVKIRFRYATSDSSIGIPGGTGWLIEDIVLSSSPSVSNTAKLFTDKGNLSGYSTAITKLEGSNANDFIAKKRNDAEALLSWRNGGEWNGSYSVERSTDKGVRFKEIGSVHARGDRAGMQTYSFTDAAPAAGTNLYRIRHLNSNGAVQYTAVKALHFDDKAIRIAPNPAKERLQVLIPGNSKIATLQLTDGLGKTIRTYKAAGQNIELKLPVLAAGMYYLNIIKGDGTTSRHKVMIE